MNADALHRMLRGAGGGAGRDGNGAGGFVLAELGRTLQSDIAGSMRPAALLAGQAQYKVWAIFQEVIKNGTPGFERVFRKPLFEFLNAHAEIHELFDQTMTNNMQWARDAVLHHCTFEEEEIVVDVGGGWGVCWRADGKISGDEGGAAGNERDRRACAAILPASIEVVAGIFGYSIPRADTIILSCILHMQGDAEAVEMLRKCAGALSAGGRVLIVEQVLREPNVRDAGKWSDLNMLVMTGGRERTFAEYEELLGAAGFAKGKLIETDTPYRLIVSRRAD